MCQHHYGTGHASGRAVGVPPDLHFAGVEGGPGRVWRERRPVVSSASPRQG